jgi:hypothetical protein
MPNEFDETTYFRYARTLNGKLEPVSVARRNGRNIPLFSPCHLEPDPVETKSDLKSLVRELMYGLNRTERRTWLLLLLGYSVLDVAQSEKVTRPAIYERIRGSSKGHGGMVRKNDYVRIWWELRGGKATV